jgi:peroxiredoxin
MLRWRRRKLCGMLEVGDRIPDATVWFAPRETISLRDVVEDRPALFLFYLFDWSST